MRLITNISIRSVKNCLGRNNLQLTFIFPYFLAFRQKGYFDTLLTKEAPKSKMDGDSDVELYAECDHGIRETIRAIVFLKIGENR